VKRPATGGSADPVAGLRGLAGARGYCGALNEAEESIVSKLTPRILAALVLPCVLSAEVPDTSVFSTDVTNAAKPWTHLNFRNSAEAFQFAIVSDRCGGHRPGVFEEAMDKLNLLEPEFVVCVGDLIEGYTQEEAALTGMWAELREIVARLTMPFFYVPGNHDVSDPAMDGRWDRIFGRRYYSFVYRDVLFLCLNSQDRGERRTGLSDAQIAWAREVLARHPAVRWTCLFMHQPLWVYEEGATETSRKSITEKEDTGFPQIESALAGRNYTVFAGHFHQYIRYRRHGQRYYVLASTGGASNLRGAAQGEFDHVAWVTMRPGGPLVVNLTLDGILRDDTYTEAHLLAARTLRFPDPWRPIGERPFSLTLPLRWRNPFEQSGTGLVAGGRCAVVSGARRDRDEHPGARQHGGGLQGNPGRGGGGSDSASFPACPSDHSGTRGHPGDGVLAGGHEALPPRQVAGDPVPRDGGSRKAGRAVGRSRVAAAAGHFGHDGALAGPHAVGPDAGLGGARRGEFLPGRPLHGTEPRGTGGQGDGAGRSLLG
jgi:hypothetical protein